MKTLIKYKEPHLVRLAVDSVQRGVADPGHPGELGEVGRGRGGVAVREQHHLAAAVLWSRDHPPKCFKKFHPKVRNHGEGPY